MGRSTGYIIGFAVAVCLVCSVVVATSAVGLKERQEVNKVLDRQSKVLAVAGLMQEGEALPPAQIQQLFEENIKAQVVKLETGEYDEKIEIETFDQLKASKDPETSSEAKPNKAKVLRMPHHALVYKLMKGNDVDLLILPVEGKGLWSTLYGFIALEKDAQTIRGITFYQHGETPGLGGEVDNPGWKSKWKGRKAFDEKGVPAITVIKGSAGSAEEAPYKVDGISGATITANGVTYLVQYWLGAEGFGPFIANFKQGGA
jgi:Na+-transporting NADH:ubiquinone oxidoreductase subunit C